MSIGTTDPKAELRPITSVFAIDTPTLIHPGEPMAADISRHPAMIKTIQIKIS